jgi:hypothetical protein
MIQNLKNAALFFLLMKTCGLSAQPLNIDTLAIQDFETTPSTPTWNYTITSTLQPSFSTGFSGSANCSPTNSPLGIGASTAWNSTSVSGGVTLRFDDVFIPTTAYDSIRFSFRLAAFNLISSSGGPDNLDYVAVAVSTNGGASYYPRLRIRGAVANNCTWAYDATGIAKVDYLPASEVTFAPNNSGLQTSEGYSYCEITFPGTIQTVRFEITGRSSSSSDTWLIDNVMVTGENNCLPDVAYDTVLTCYPYLSPAGNIYSQSGIYSDTLQNASGCDSIIITNLTVTPVNATTTIGSASLVCNQSNATYQWLDCNNALQPIVGETGQSFVPIVGGSFAVVVTYQGCVDTSVCVTVSFTDLSEHTTTQVLVFPNPVNDVLNLLMQNASKERAYHIENINGQKILSGYMSETSHVINTSALPDGIYCLRVANGRSARFVVQH